MSILKGYFNTNCLFIFVLKCPFCSMHVYYLLCSKKFCGVNSIRISQALNFMERKVSGPFRSMSGFTTGPLPLIRSPSVGKGTCPVEF